MTGHAESPCTCFVVPEVPINECFGALPNEGECCEVADCGGAPPGTVCIAGGFDNQGAYCGGAAPPPWNDCRQPACVQDTDCAADGVCLAAGGFGHVVNTCVRAACRRDADCRRAAGGECHPFFARCYGFGFACVYPEDICRTNQDCPPGGQFEQVCVPVANGDGTRCVEDIPRP